MTSEVVVYSTESCPYCIQAKRLLQSRGVAFREVQISMDDNQAWDELYQRSRMRTVPQIFAGERLIGGYTELSALDRQDQLASLK